FSAAIDGSAIQSCSRLRFSACMSGICASTTALSSSACAASTPAGSAASAATDSELRTKSRRLTSASDASDMEPPGVYQCVRSATITRAGAQASEGIVDAAEDRHLAATVAHIDITHHVRAGDAAHTEPNGGVHIGIPIATRVGKHLAGVDKGRGLQAHMCSESAEAEDSGARLRARGPYVLVHQTVTTALAQPFPPYRPL